MERRKKKVLEAFVIGRLPLLGSMRPLEELNGEVLTVPRTMLGEFYPISMLRMAYVVTWCGAAQGSASYRNESAPSFTFPVQSSSQIQRLVYIGNRHAYFACDTLTTRLRGMTGDCGKPHRRLPLGT